MKSYFRLFLLLIILTASTVIRAGTIQIVVTGIEGQPQTNVIAQLQAEAGLELENFSQSQLDDFMKTAPSVIRKALEPFGYFKPRVTNSKLTRDKSGLIASFHINPGPAIQFSSVQVTLEGNGKNNRSLLKLQHHFPLKPGMVFASEAYENAKETLFQTAKDEGYIKARFIRSQVRVNLGQYRADVILVLDTGDRYYFGNFTYGSSPYSPAFLNRFEYFKDDAHFSSKKLYQFQQSLSNSGYFQRVDVIPDFNHIENYHVPVKVDMTAPKSQRYDFGLGYGTFTGPRLSAGINLRRVTDTGQHFNAELKLSSVFSALAAKYYIPGPNPLTDEFLFGAGYQKFSPKNGKSYSKNLSAGYTKKLKHWRSSLTLHYLSERFSTDTQSSTNSELLYPALNLSYIKADDIINPHHGLSINLTLQGATKTLLSSTNFLQGEIKGKTIFSAGDDNRFVLRGDAGYTLVNNIDDLPLTLRYFAGGLTSIRGYADSSIGPGKYLVTGSAEYQRRIWENWFGAVFYDTGTASDHYGDPPFAIGDGVGVIYQSLVGPIRLYLARAENKRGKPYSIEFNVGPEF